MIDPVIFSREIFGMTITLRWYGVIVMIGVIVGSLIVERQLRQRGENGDRIWDALIWVLPAGIVGARFWYVLNATLGGNRYYIENPAQIINIPQGGLHIFGGFLFGGIALLLYLNRNRLDPWLFLDVVGPALLIGQAIGRIANFINQELYGPPTTLPWGIPISAEHRIALYSDLSRYPVETTRFHPTFAYEILWNLFAAGLLLWLYHRYKKDLKPGTLFAAWLVLAGVGRVFIEFFRPDQPKIADPGFSYSTLFAALMAITGAILLLVRYKVIHLKFAENWEEEYNLAGKPVAEGRGLEEKSDSSQVKKPAKSESLIQKKAKAKIAARKAGKKSATRTTGEKES